MSAKFCTQRLLRALGVLCATLVLSGCQVELYTGLDENQGNEMLAILLSHNLQARKLPGKDSTVSLSVDEADVAAAVELLKASGYPRDQFASLGSIFEKEGLISSPLEERARYIYGLSQTVSETLSLIDGVLVSRVHIVLPETQPLEEVPRPSSASVFIKYREGYDIEASIPKIKGIVENSVEGLNYDKISVALFPVKRVELPVGPPLKKILGVQVAADSAETLMAILVGLGAAAILSLGTLVGLHRRSTRAAAAATTAEQ